MDIKSFQEIFNPELKIILSHKIKQISSITKQDDINKFLQYIQTYIFSGGKRIRPYSAYLGYKGFGGDNNKEFIAFSTVFELLHNMALIHDDFMDKSNIRHNVDTIHNYINKKINNPHLADSQAVLIGDLIFNRTYEILYKPYNFQTNNLTSARLQIHQMLDEVIAGQMIDVHMMTGKKHSSQIINQKNLYKTARYTFARPLLVGSILANAPKTEQDKIFSLGENLGIAYQIKDDYSDIIHGDSTKSRFSDIQEGQQTLFTCFIFENGTDKQKELLNTTLGKKLNNQQIQELQTMFQTSGAIDYAQTQVQKYLNQAQTILEDINFNNNNIQKHFLYIIEKTQITPK